MGVSSQHAVIQYRRVKRSVIRPYIMDLKSRHGTYLMGDKMEPHRFYELLPKDKIQFGRSTREYIVLVADLIKEDEMMEVDEEEQKNEDANDRKETEKEEYNIWSDDDD